MSQLHFHIPNDHAAPISIIRLSSPGLRANSMASKVPSKRSPSVISISPPPSKRKRSCSPDSFSGDSEDQINVFIIDAKLNAETVEELISLIEEFKVKDATKELQLSSNAENADIIITEVRMRKRLERHLDWNTAVGYTVFICHSAHCSMVETKGHCLPTMAQRQCTGSAIASLRKIRCTRRTIRRDCQ